MIFPVIVFLLILALDRYAFEGVRTLVPERFHRIAGFTYWSFNLLLLAGLIWGSIPGNRGSLGGKIFFNVFITLFATKITFILVLFGEDIYRGVSKLIYSFTQNANSNRPPDLNRRKFVSWLGLALASIPFASFFYGITKGKYDYRVHRKILYFDNLPEAFNGFTLAQLSDIHAGSFDNFQAVQRGVEMVKALNADLFVFTGDLVNSTSREIEPYLDLFGSIQAPFGKFAILGNHDYGDYFHWSDPAAKQADHRALHKHHQTLGHTLLLNESVRIEKDGAFIDLVGVENWGAGFIQRGDLDRALQGLPEDSFKILLSHDPSHWDYHVKNHPVHIPLTLSGHTHGMQFGIEVGSFKWSPVKYRYPNWADLAEENGRRLYVNRGFGFLGFSGRVGIWPEITMLELRRSESHLS